MSLIKTKRKGIFKNKMTGKFLARITVNGEQLKATFDTEYQAINWRLAVETGMAIPKKEDDTSTLELVWQTMQEKHFPLLAPSTKQIWERRYSLLKDLEQLPMGDITVSKVTTWVEEKVKYFKSEEYIENSRGLAKRCNLDNELNLLTTIFNWYKSSEDFESEAAKLTNPVKTKHKKMGQIRVRPVKDKAITLDAALQFFHSLKPLYRDLALLQYFTASRIGEAAGLQWSRIDFKNDRITIMETCQWDMTTKMFVALNPHPKNKEPRPVYLTTELREILSRRMAFKIPGNDFVFHVDGLPLNYGTIQLNYREAQRKSRVPYTGTHILRHGMATLAREVGGGLDAVIAMTGHKDFKLADHYSKLTSKFQKETSIKIMERVKSAMNAEDEEPTFENVIKFAR